MKEALKMHEEKKDSIEVLHARSDFVDQIVQSLFEEVCDKYQKSGKEVPKNCSVLSQGGYGRRELCLKSDIDLLFLYEGRADAFVKLLTEKMVQKLWDDGFEVGCATRTVRDCRKLMDTDLTIMTSLLDARHLAGSQDLSAELFDMVRRYFSSHRENFFKLRMQENKERQEKYGGSVYRLEPNLKEGEGGLRDYHTLYWLARVQHQIRSSEELRAHQYLSEEEYQSLWKAVQFLWQVRNELHRRAGRRTDQLIMEYQEPIAHWLGYENTKQFLGVELFMQYYYTQAAIIHGLTEKVTRRLTRTQPALFPVPSVIVDDPHLKVVEERLTINSPDLFQKKPEYLLKVFSISHHLKMDIDDFTSDKIEKESFLLQQNELRNSAELGALFRGMLSNPSGLGKIFTRMNGLGILGVFLPEFEKLRFRVQHDIYHVYTVDVHSIFAVQELGKLVDGEYEKTNRTLHELVKDISRMDVLSFGILYHDIGKGEGKGHVQKGAPLIRQAGTRLGFTPVEVDRLEFLELSHLIMTHIAFRRDLEDQNLIIQFAKAMRNMELLNMLYVLTFCDVKAVSPEAMTDWKASLIEYLYLKTREVLQKGTFTREKASALVPKVLNDVLSLLTDEEEKRKCREFFAIMPSRYLLSASPSLIAHHVRLWEKFLQEPIVFEPRVLEKEGVNEVTLLTWDTKDLFSRMTGLFAAHNLNIVEAQLTVSSQGHALHTFKITDHEGKPIPDSDRWVRLENDLRDILQGRIKIENLVAEKFKPSLFKKKMAQTLPTRMDIDNDISAFYTVIDLYTHDRVGLLYQITSTLAALGLYVDVSKISTKVDQVADTFYVKDIFGHKVTSEERLKKIKAILQKVIEEEPTPGWRPEA